MILNYHNPVSPEYFADPFVLKHDGWYYAYGTSGAQGQQTAFPVMRSRDLTAWETLGDALQVAPQFRGGAHWAPEVAFRDGVFWMYYSAAPASSNAETEADDANHRLRVARATHPAGRSSIAAFSWRPARNFPSTRTRFATRKPMNGICSSPKISSTNASAPRWLSPA